ncbi:hypothetical protein BS47DRAFT_1348656 [Hydnum rufescens UP504]|uniref:FAD-binding PCMH-type domain-containing protein n=1 Tax=Hydnum rufescens UP504 TaxID=1448309 RepID=A0A9P6AQ63_9AGAM|nr:hypothetical protein BS47DRAFT_1348656 [Hydnum rufescens UP504]
MFTFAVFICLIPLGFCKPLQTRDSQSLFNVTCHHIARVISSASAVYYPGSPQFISDIEHWAPSSTQVSACSVEPGTVKDVAAIVNVLARSTTPFSIQSGGHATSVGFSSTLGVAINLVRLNSMAYDPTSRTVTIGTGQTWSDLFQKLEPLELNVAGGRMGGVGVGGLALGGGYSWLSNRHGLTIDTITALELVLPNSTVVHVTPSSAPELFFGLRGGFNNFGIVTKITMRAYKQGPVWGGVLSFDADKVEAVNAALAKFSASNTDPDGNCLFNFFWSNGVLIAGTLQLFYNGPEPPSGLFSEFLSIPHTSKDLGTRSFLNFTKALSVVNPLKPTHLRVAFSSVSMPHIAVPVLKDIIQQGQYYSRPGVFSTQPFVSFAVEPFYWKSMVRPRDDAAYPHDVFVNPLNLFFGWPNATEDAAASSAIKGAGANITQALINNGQDLTGTVLYPNYALGDATIESLYGANVPALKALRSKYDPKGVFLRTGGYKFI